MINCNHSSIIFFVLQQRQNLGRRFGISKMHINPLVAVADVRSKAVVLLLLIRFWLLPPLWDSVIVLCFVVRYFVSILVLQSSWWGKESWLLCFVCLPCVWWLLCGSSSRCHAFVCSLWLWYCLIIHTYFLRYAPSEVNEGFKNGFTIYWIYVLELAQM